jgi:hypothetical protein
MIEDRAVRGTIPEQRNLWAYAALWMVTLSWVGLGARLLAGHFGRFDSALDIAYLATIPAGFLLAVAAVAAIRKRGEPVLAITVLLFSLTLPVLYVLFFVLVDALFGPGLGRGD